MNRVQSRFYSRGLSLGDMGMGIILGKMIHVIRLRASRLAEEKKKKENRESAKSRAKTTREHSTLSIYRDPSLSLSVSHFLYTERLQKAFLDFRRCKTFLRRQFPPLRIQRPLSLSLSFYTQRDFRKLFLTFVGA